MNRFFFKFYPISSLSVTDTIHTLKRHFSLCGNSSTAVTALKSHVAALIGGYKQENVHLLWKMSSDRREHSCQQDPGGRAAASVISFPCSVDTASKSKEVNELNQCSRLAAAGGKEQPGAGEGFSAGSWAELPAWPGCVKGQQPMAPWSSPRHLRSLGTKPASSCELSGNGLG